MIRSIYDFNFAGKRVLVRVDFNVPLDGNNNVADDTRIVETLPTIDKIIDDGGIPILISHLGRPKGEPNPKYSLFPVAQYMEHYYGYNVIFSPDCIGESAKKAVEGATFGDVVLLENVRFYKGEEENSIEFAKQLRALADSYVNDAFASCHRAHASTDAVARLFEERFAGKLLLNEIHYFGKAIQNPPKPFTAIIGGAKITGKIDIIHNLMQRCDNIIVGGGLAYTFLSAKGYSTGSSIVETEKIDLAKSLLSEAEQKGINLILPTDVIIADEMDNTAHIKNVNFNEIADNWMGVDIGEKTRNEFREIILNSKTIVWNGPVGVFEIEKFAEGTKVIAYTLADATSRGAITIVGGGDSASAMAKLNLKDKVSHVSTGGGASLDFLGGKTLPGLAALEV